MTNDERAGELRGQSQALTEVALGAGIDQSKIETEGVGGENGPGRDAKRALPCVPGYVVLEEVGRGGMGVVYKARQLALDRLVALKMIRVCYHTEEERRRFQAEGQALASLQHPHVVQVYEVGEVEGQPFLALEWAQGGGLDRRLAGKPQPPAEAARLVEVLARTTYAVHRRGIVHRDLKPSNVLLGENGAPKITDFGLAKKLDSTAGETASGAVLGTPGYMAPEQAAGQARAVGPAADTYSLGAILYEALTGHPPFKGLTVLDTLDQVRSRDPVPPRSLQPRVPRDLETVCLKCLEKEPNRRYASALDLADDLARFQAGEPIRARPAGAMERGWRWCRRRPVPAALIAVSALSLLALLAGAFWFVAAVAAADGRAEAADAEKRIAEAERHAEEVRAAAARDEALTQQYHSLVNGARMRAARQRPGWTWACLNDLSRAARLGSRARELPQLREEAAVCLSAIDVRPGKVLVRGFSASRLAYSPSGKFLALGQERATAFVSFSMLVVDADSGEVVHKLVYAARPAFNEGSLAPDRTTALAFSPDGRWLAVGTRIGQVHRWDMKQKAPALRSWSAHKATVRLLSFGADGKSLLSVGEDRAVARWDVETGRQALPPFVAKHNLTHLAVSPDREQLAYADGGDLHFLDAKTLRASPTRPSRLGAGGAMAFAPDGRGLVVNRDRVLQVLDLARGKFAHTWHAPDGEYAHEKPFDHLVYSPDGALLACASQSSRHVQLWEAASGRLLADLPIGSGELACAFRPGGRALVVSDARQVRVYELGGLREQTFLAPHLHALRGLALSEEGQSLACVADVFGSSWAELTVQPLRSSLDHQGAGPSCRVPHLLQGQGLGRVAFHPRGGWVALAGRNHLFVRDAKTGAVVASPSAEDASAVRFGPDGRLWAAQGDQVQAWALPACTRGPRWANAYGRHVLGLGGLWDVAVGPRWVVAAGRDGFAHLLRAADGGHQASRRVSKAPLTRVALSPDEPVAALGSFKGEVQLWLVPDGAPVAVAPAHEARVTAIAFARGGLFATGSRDRTIRLWRRSGSSAEAVLTLRVTRPVQELAFTPDGRKLLVLLRDERAVRVWHLDRMEERLAALGLGRGAGK